MTSAKSAIATIALSGIIAVGAAAIAQEDRTGTLILIDRINRSVGVQQAQTGTVGATPSFVTEQFSVQPGLSLDNVHVGDTVAFATTDSNGIKTVTRLEKQKPKP